jgi:hypothetical protein
MDFDEHWVVSVCKSRLDDGIHIHFIALLYKDDLLTDLSAPGARALYPTIAPDKEPCTCFIPTNCDETETRMWHGSNA